MFELGEYIKATKDWEEKCKQDYIKWEKDCQKNVLNVIPKYNNIALYGAGNHTEQFLEYLNISGGLEKIKCIVALEKHEDIKNISVVTIDEAQEIYHVDAIIISSKLYQEEIYCRLKTYNIKNIELIRIYTPEYKEESTERAYACYDNNHILKSNIPFDHLQRYGWAQGYIRDKVVIDMACGSGYGSYWMSFAAREVVGIDISKKAIEHAKKTYRRSNCKFLCQDLYNIKEKIDADVIVSFETIEHISDEDGFFKTVNKLLRPNGVLLISTPLSECDGMSEQNPFHINEYTKEKFKKTLSKYFNSITWYRQDSGNNGAISIDDGSLERNSQSYVTILAVCSKSDN